MRTIICALAALSLFGCGSPKANETSSTNDAPVEECVELAARYRTCLESLSDGTSALTRAHVEAARQSLAKPPSNDAEREALRARCASSAAHLASACR
jgi:hypothetical protein